MTSRFQEIANRLTDEAEASASVHVYITAEDVASALGAKYDAEADPFDELRKWVAERRLLGFEPTADDILDWTMPAVETDAAA